VEVYSVSCVFDLDLIESPKAALYRFPVVDLSFEESEFPFQRSHFKSRMSFQFSLHPDPKIFLFQREEEIKREAEEERN